MTADSVATSEDDVQPVRQWVRLSCTDPGTHLPALAEIAGELRLSAPVVRSALKQLAADGMMTLHEGYRLYSVGTTTPTERTYPADADRDPPELRARRAVHDPLRSSRPSPSAPRKPRPRCARWWPKGC
ncbi:GntR family transcriptional regulator [Streptomyces mirabilis]|uniref:GntR family transcriptional regulator n=1 Tax=Streptomyces mirabilis TaxID=68239 RepID=A0ABU3V3Y1_9ACTN|nr:GntR family transcriptional regulator [Streptomyces mirabilis]MDU9000891.1 GntR family transcriptional regulator [Streptomyces mirabilis]